MAQGISLFDIVRISDIDIPDQFMIQVDSMDSQTNMRSDGILGMAHYYTKGHAATRGRTFIATLFDNYPDMPNQFSFYLTGQSDQQSMLVIGEPEIAKHSKEKAFRYGKPDYMDRTHLWLTSVWSIGWAGTGVEVAFPESGTLGAPALIDSGSSLIVLEPFIYDRLMDELKRYLGNCHRLPAQDIVMCSCPEAQLLRNVPSLVINVIDEENQQFGLCMSPDEYILQSTDPLTGQATCVPALQRGTTKQPVPMIFGMTFMRSFYTNFDVVNRRIGFARSKTSPLPGGTVCAVYTKPALRRAIWWASVVVAAFSLLFAIYVFLIPKDLACLAFLEGGSKPSDELQLTGVGDTTPQT